MFVRLYVDVNVRVAVVEAAAVGAAAVAAVGAAAVALRHESELRHMAPSTSLPLFEL